MQIGDGGIYERCISEEQLRLLQQDYCILCTGNYIGAPSAVIIRKTYLYLDETLKWDVDWEWYIRILNRNNKFYCTRLPLVSICMDSSNVTAFCQQNKELMLRESMYAYKKNTFLHKEKYASAILERVYLYIYETELKNFCADSKVFIYGAGVYGKRCATYLESRGIDFDGFVITQKDEQSKDENIFALSELISRYNKTLVKFFIAVKEAYIKEIKKVLLQNDFYVPNNIKIYKADNTIIGSL